MLDNIGPRLLYGLSGLLAGALLGAWLRPPVTETRVQELWRTRVVTETKEVVKWREKVVTKYKTRTVSKPDGTTIVETCQIGSNSTSSTQEVTNTTSSEEVKESVVTTKTTPLAAYRVGLGASWEAATSPYDLSNYRLTGEARVGNLPVWVGVWVQGDLSLGVSLGWEF